MEQDSLEPLRRLAARQASLVNGAHPISHVYELQPDETGDLTALPAWMNANPYLVTADAMAGTMRITMAVDSRLFLREQSLPGGIWEALEWWDAWVDHLAGDVQLGGAVVSVDVRPQPSGPLAGRLEWNGKRYLGLSMRHQYDYERAPSFG